MLNKKEIQEKYPKSYEKLVGWIQSILMDFQKMMMPKSEEDVVIPEIKREFAESAIDGMILGNVRSLYDFFGMQDIQVEVYIHASKQFVAEIFVNFEFDTACHVISPDRRVVEIDAFNSAFDILEKL